MYFYSIIVIFQASEQYYCTISRTFTVLLQYFRYLNSIIVLCHVLLQYYCTISDKKNKDSVCLETHGLF